ncbi:hypothetical protein BU26DRAFT_596879 [Trematosphaeria pertusa]|uniref:LigT-like protein n=1 Tax=Trematosphaeria pertusa TaxID=390896 RepID=A0A6A6I966_9PLEO|nr:uncharacterized protein BU26DRAFT_596879 [Trematosphaeria pertusa]KAF2247105.1 hypothetical protein BU26DRAFT_596879 [Trematosphaeria pertusa]
MERCKPIAVALRQARPPRPAPPATAARRGQGSLTRPQTPSLTMAARLPPHLSHKSALALLPPSTIVAPIEAVRRVHDRHFARWPPHINLIYPFLASPSEVEDAQQGDHPLPPHLKEGILLRVQKAVKEINPFHMSLLADSPGAFSHSKRSKTVWLDPSSDSVSQLQAALQAEFAECDANGRPFTPHLSVGQANSDAGARKLGEEIKTSISEFLGNHPTDQPIALGWYVDTVYVLERKGFHDRFKILGAVELGKE